MQNHNINLILFILDFIKLLRCKDEHLCSIFCYTLLKITCIIHMFHPPGDYLLKRKMLRPRIERMNKIPCIITFSNCPRCSHLFSINKKNTINASVSSPHKAEQVVTQANQSSKSRIYPGQSFYFVWVNSENLVLTA